MKAKYIGLFAVILIFGIIFVPKIHDRIVNNTIVDNTRMSTAKSQEADVVVDTSKKSAKSYKVAFGKSFKAKIKLETSNFKLRTLL